MLGAPERIKLEHSEVVTRQRRGREFIVQSEKVVTGVWRLQLTQPCVPLPSLHLPLQASLV